MTPIKLRFRIVVEVPDHTDAAARRAARDFIMRLAAELVRAVTRIPNDGQ